jgi:Na+-transporting methylmalonyl-CoA/oxaloacetate decarboxylase beta subunit
MQISHSFIVHLFHLIIVGSLFLYVGIMQTNIPGFLYPILFYLGIFIIIYHSYKAYKKIKGGKNAWTNFIHILLVGPLLIYIGYNNNKTPRYCYELILMLGFAAIGYHGYYLLLGD